MQKGQCIYSISSGPGANLESCQFPTQLTARELEVEELLCRGYSHRNIATILGRSASTISVHVTNVYKKRGVHTQVCLLLAYLERRQISVFGDKTERLACRLVLKGTTGAS
jgi:DNA-binding NarL/FixJ family response regulator